MTPWVAPAITTQNGCHGSRQCRAHAAGERSEMSSGKEETLQLIWNFRPFENLLCYKGCSEIKYKLD